VCPIFGVDVMVVFFFFFFFFTFLCTLPPHFLEASLTDSSKYLGQGIEVL
jgi:hypothetical protein